MQALQATYGSTIPDVEFVIGTADMPEMFLETPVLREHPPQPPTAIFHPKTEETSQSESDPFLETDMPDANDVVNSLQAVPHVATNTASASDKDSYHKTTLPPPLPTQQLHRRTLKMMNSLTPESTDLLGQRLLERVRIQELQIPEDKPTDGRTTGFAVDAELALTPTEGISLDVSADQMHLSSEVHSQQHRALPRQPDSSSEFRSVMEDPNVASPPLLVLRFCKSAHHADVLVPDIHFQVRVQGLV